jgi:hypothetical protein
MEFQGSEEKPKQSCKNKVGELLFPDFKPHYKAILIKMM